jgi:Fic family protein
MAKKKYHVESTYPKNRKPYFSLVKDIKVMGQKRKVRVYLGTKQPTAQEIEQFREIHAFTLESRAAIKTRYLDLGQLKNIEYIKYLYQTFTSLLTTDEIQAYEQNFEINYIQGTTSIEGNTLSLNQTSDLLINGLTPNGKALREINEVQNFKQVKTFRDKYRGKITLDFIKTIHMLIMNNIDLVTAGQFRRIDIIGIGGCDLMVTPAALIEEELQKAIDEYYDSLNNIWHPFEAAALFHYKFEMIHPFTDGNGRVGREIFNCMLTRIGYPRLLFLGSDRQTYIQLLKNGNNGDYSSMIWTFADLLTENLEKVVAPAKKSGQLRLQDFFL